MLTYAIPPNGDTGAISIGLLGFYFTFHLNISYLFAEIYHNYIVLNEKESVSAFYALFLWDLISQANTLAKLE